MKIVNTAKKIINSLRTEKITPIKCSIENGNLLEGKTALIIGGSGGIGKAIAKEFLKQKCNVIIAGTNLEKTKKCADEIGIDKWLTLDITNVGAISENIKRASDLAECAIDIFVNATGINDEYHFGNVTEAQYDRVMDVNLKGAYFLCQAAGNYMISNSIHGHILNLSSASALRPAWTPYQLSKHAIKGMTVGFADKLLPHGIVVNSIAPGPVATEMLGKKSGDSIDMTNQPSHRYALPEEIAALAVYMVSDLGDLIVGDTFYITGGSGIVSLHH